MSATLTKYINPCSHARRTLFCTTICIFCILLCGCFLADNKFYYDTDLITDSHFVGTFTPSAAITNEEYSRCSLNITSGANRHYMGTYSTQDKWIKYDIALFRLGTNTFIDIHPLATGDIVTSSKAEPKKFFHDMIDAIVVSKIGECGHCAFNTVISKGQIDFRFVMAPRALDVLYSKAPELKRGGTDNLKLTGTT
jgi:hypothetical protein